MNPKIGETIQLDFVTEGAAGSPKTADAVSCAVFGSQNDTPVLTPTPVEREGRAGHYRVDIDTASLNAGESYNVSAAATVDGVDLEDVIATFVPRGASVDDAANNAASATSAASEASTTASEAVNYASSALTAILNVQNNSWITTDIPPVLERPDGEDVEYLTIRLCFSGSDGGAADLDGGASPTIVLVGSDGTDMTGRLSGLDHPEAGKYTIVYQNSGSDAVDALAWEITGVVSGKLRRYVARMQIVDTTAIDFTSADRSNLSTLLARIPGTVQPQTGDAYARIGAAGAGLTAIGDTRIGAIKAKTDNLPPSPAAVGSAMALSSGERSTLVGLIWSYAASSITTAGSIGKFILTRLGLITSGNIYAVGGFVAGTLTIRQGNSYTVASGQPLPIDKPATATTWPADLTDWTVTLYGRANPDMQASEGTLTLQTVLSVNDPAGAQQLLLDNLQAATTLALAPKVNGWTFEIEATKDGDVNTLMSGTLSVAPRVARS